MHPNPKIESSVTQARLNRIRIMALTRSDRPVIMATIATHHCNNATVTNQSTNNEVEMAIISISHQEDLGKLIGKIAKVNPNFNVVTKTAFYYAMKKVVNGLVCGFDWVKTQPSDKSLIIDCVEAIEIVSVEGLDWVVKAIKNDGVVSSFNNEIPKEFYRDCQCDHCHTKHERRKTWILQNTLTNEWVELGSGCVGKYTGMSVKAFNSIEGFYGELDKLSLSKREPAYSNIASDLPRFLAAAYAYFEGVGYKFVSKRQSELSGQERTIDDFIKTEVCINEDHEQMASQCLAWFEGIEKDTDFVMNIATIVSSGFVTESQVGMMLYLPILMKESQPQANSGNGFIGQVKDKVALIVTFEKFEKYYHDHGEGYNYTFITEDGDIVTWSTAKTCDDLGMEINYKYCIAGTVKLLRDYRGKQSTALTRCKITRPNNCK